jgi:hypothetical protein
MSGGWPDYWEEAEPRRARPRSRGPAITPGRVVLLLALVASLAVAVYAGFVDRETSQIPLFGAALAVAGLALVGFAVVGVRASMEAGRRGESGRAFLAALAGGLCALAAAGALGSALVLVLLWSTTKPAT